VSSVSAAAFSVDWLLTAVEAAHYGHGGILRYVLRRCCAPTNRTAKPHKNVM